MQSFGRPRPTTNPYIIMLGRALQETEDVELLPFSWRAALFASYDAFHFHWPETLLGGSSPARAVAKRVLFSLLLARLRWRRVAVIRTVHNLELPQDVSRWERRLLQLVERMTTLRITLSRATRLPADQPHHVILHGHYKDWFGSYRQEQGQDGRLAFVGLIRRYKGVETLLAAFRGTVDRAPDLRLTVSGNPSSEHLAEEVREAQRQDPRISSLLKFLDDQELVSALTMARLVVLPYRFMHNSGAVLAALSVDRPVLVPDNEANRLLTEEVGPGWVRTFDGDLDSDALLSAVRGLDADPPGGSPDLSARDWHAVGQQHHDAYAAALHLKAARRRRRRGAPA